MGKDDDIEEDELESETSASINYGSKIIDFIRSRNVKKIKYLLKQMSKVDYDINRHSAILHELVEEFGGENVKENLQNFQNILDSLIDNNYNINKTDTKLRITALHKAAQISDCENIIQKLIKKGSLVDNGDCWGRTALHYAAERGYLSNVECLLQNGADIFRKDFSKDGCLHFAAKARTGHVIQLLLNNEANAKSVNSSNQTPLHFAANFGSASTLTALIRSFSNDKEMESYVNQVDNCGYSALQIAAKNSKSGKSLKILLQAGANPNSANWINGDTPLHESIRFRMVDNAITLLQHKADINKTNFHDESSLHTLFNLDTNDSNNNTTNSSTIPAASIPKTCLWHDLWLELRQIKYLNTQDEWPLMSKNVCKMAKLEQRKWCDDGYDLIKSRDENFDDSTITKKVNRRTSVLQLIKQ